MANLADYGHLVGAGAGMQDVFRGEIEATAKMMAKAHDAGVPLLCGSESGFALTPYGHWHARAPIPGERVANWAASSLTRKLID